MRGLYIGRFQPFHRGHLEVVRSIIGKVDELIIVVGSAQYSHTTRNPFTAGERYEMIRAALIEDGHSPTRFMIVTVEDINKHSLWVAHVRSMVPAFDVVYTNEPLNERLFEEAGCRVEQVPLFSRDIYSSTHVREQCRTSQGWTSLVPPAVAEVIERIDGTKRLCMIHDSDT